MAPVGSVRPGEPGLSHVHVGSLHAPDSNWRWATPGTCTRAGGKAPPSGWSSDALTTSDPDLKEEFFESASGKNCRHATYYREAEGVKHL